MADLIERELALQAMEICGHKNAAHLISEIPSAIPWIPCSERMPAEWQIVAAYGEKIGLKCVEWHPETGVFIDTQSEYGDQIKSVYFTRWIPLPEQP